MSIRTITPPAAEPATLAEMKLFLRVDHDDEDSLIAALIRTARERVEAATGRALITRTVVESFDAWDAGRRWRALSLSPAIAIAETRTLDEDGAAAVFPADKYYLDPAASPSRLVLAGGAAWPRPGRASGGVEIEYAAGYGEEPDDVPDALRQAVRELVAEAYERGGPEGTFGPSVRALIAPFARARL